MRGVNVYVITRVSGWTSMLHPYIAQNEVTVEFFRPGGKKTSHPLALLRGVSLRSLWRKQSMGNLKWIRMRRGISYILWQYCATCWLCINKKIFQDKYLNTQMRMFLNISVETYLVVFLQYK